MSRRRSWQILRAGAVVSELARRHEISPQLLSAWRKAARHGLLRPPDGTEPMARRPAGTPAIQDRSPSSGVASSALGGPGPGHEFVQARSRPEIDQLGEHVGQIGLRIDAVEFAGLDERGDAGPILGALIVTGEQRIFAIEGHCPFILPMSGRSWKSITGSIRISAARSWCVAWSSERRANFLRCRDRPASLYLSPVGCSIL